MEEGHRSKQDSKGRVQTGPREKNFEEQQTDFESVR